MMDEASRIVKRVAITGAAGSLAHDIIPALQELGYELIGVDRDEPDAALELESVRSSITDRDRLFTAFAGCDAVIHLAGIPLEADWQTLLEANIDGTQAVLEAAHRQGIRRVILASSIHASGFVRVPLAGEKVPDDVPVRPNTFYGVTKAAVEALGSMYHHRFGMDIVCLRIASRFDHPLGERMLSTWLSPADAVRLFAAALSAPSPGFVTVWGVSANTRGYLSPDGGRSIGYHPVDDAETYAASLLGAGPDANEQDDSVFASEWDRAFIGGVFSSPHPPRFGE